MALIANYPFNLAASPVFAAMLTTDMLERQSATVSIKDFDDKVLKTMLEYIYQGQLPFDLDWLSQLMLAAEKYDLGLLKADCEVLLIKYLKLTPNMAADTLVMADSSKANNLTEFVVAYIKR